MRFLNILEYPDIKLRIKAKPLSSNEVPENIPLIKDLAYTMYKADGVGLAATQVGEDKRIIVIDISRKTDKDKIFSLDEGNILNANKDLIVAINPEIISKEGKTVYEEGCLSIPKFNADIERASEIKVRALDLSGKEIIVEAQGLLGIVFQHEIDHLDGILFIDKASPLKRSLYNAALKKSKVKKQEKDVSYTS
ncbi:MAG: peptide deformylase [Candidatus Acidulodesulfobacterium ferriphilum]|jgi:peptide deformylase|uniref:Peptide deformylase n=1 Tax=Candidatus Acidulodesulfobacterium ferriphilum TaxID=2597223 RepID=A0A519B9Q0_9DELT|nr:MAG: peptide deformylase [Candidatus Acidulodesulfobacterium ferriphilum]